MKQTLTDQINELMNKTADAYSRSRYGEQAWRWAIVLLLTHRYTPSETYQILMSKYMRWAADAHASFCPDGDERLSGEEIIHYRKKEGINIKGLMASV